MSNWAAASTIFNGGGYSSRFRNSAIIGRLGLNLRW